MTDRPLRVFVSGIRNRAHVVYVASWLRTQLTTRTGPITVVDWGGGGFLSSGPVTPADLDGLLPRDPRLTRISPRGSGRTHARAGEDLAYVAVGAPGIKPWLRLRAAHPLRRLPVVVTDEGVGSYGSWQARRDAWVREGGHEPWPTMRAVAVFGARRLLTTRRWSLYEERSGRWRLNETVAAEFRRGQSDEGAREPRAVFLTQPWVELGVLTDAAYRAHLRAVAATCEAAGFTFAIRPHPGETGDRYSEWEVLTGATPAELDPRITRASAVLGASSTALLNLAAIFRMRAYRVGGKELAVLDEQLSHRQRELFDTFLPPVVLPADLRMAE